MGLLTSCSGGVVDAADAGPIAARVLVATERPVAELDPRYLSFALDSSNIRNDYDFTRPRLRRMTAELAPAFLRIGGTLADKTYYDLSDAPVSVAPPPDELVLTRTWWDGACQFATDLGLSILFTLNAGAARRDADGSWTPDNARTLIEYTTSNACPVAVWELGNEVNGFFVTQEFTLDPGVYAADVALARALIDASDPDALLAGPASLYWPVWGELPSFLPQFAEAGAAPLDVISWHYYPQQSSRCPIASRRASEDTLLDPANLDEVSRWQAEIASLRALHAPAAQIWLGETGHALCGGEVDLSDRFATGFWWLDQLALLAKRGDPVMVRQTLTGGRYHLIDNTTLEPAPDYFNSLLWKRLMGTRVLDASVSSESATQALRIYAHCTPSAVAEGSVTVLAIVLDRERAASLSFDGLGERREVYLLTGPALREAELRLNDVVLAVAADGSPPALAPRVASDPIVLPPLSYAFIVLPDANAAACR